MRRAAVADRKRDVRCHGPPIGCAGLPQNVRRRGKGPPASVRLQRSPGWGLPPRSAQNLPHCAGIIKKAGWAPAVGEGPPGCRQAHWFEGPIRDGGPARGACCGAISLTQFQPAACGDGPGGEGRNRRVADRASVVSRGESPAGWRCAASAYQNFTCKRRRGARQMSGQWGLVRENGAWHPG
jgi:hypothetical protein